MGGACIQHNRWPDCYLGDFGGLGAGFVSAGLFGDGLDSPYVSQEASVALVSNNLNLAYPTTDCVKREVVLFELL